MASYLLESSYEAYRPHNYYYRGALIICYQGHFDIL